MILSLPHGKCYLDCFLRLSLTRVLNAPENQSEDFLVSVKSLGPFWIKMRGNQVSFNTDISFGGRGRIHHFMRRIYELDPETVGKLER